MRRVTDRPYRYRKEGILLLTRPRNTILLGLFTMSFLIVPGQCSYFAFKHFVRHNFLFLIFFG